MAEGDGERFNLSKAKEAMSERREGFNPINKPEPISHLPKAKACKEVRKINCIQYNSHSLLGTITRNNDSRSRRGKERKKETAYLNVVGISKFGTLLEKTGTKTKILLWIMMLVQTTTTGVKNICAVDCSLSLF